MDPDNISSQDTDANLIPESTLFGKLVTGESWSVLGYLKVRSVTRNKTIIAFVSLESILPNNLKQEEGAIVSTALAEIEHEQ